MTCFQCNSESKNVHYDPIFDYPICDYCLAIVELIIKMSADEVEEWLES